MSKTPTVLFAALAALVAGACNSGSSTLARMIDADMASFITIEEALEAARAEVPDGVVVEAELEIEDDDGENEPPAWEVVLFRDGANQLVEVEIHAVTGGVLEVEIEDDDEDDDD